MRALAQRDDRPKHEHPADRRQGTRDPLGTQTASTTVNADGVTVTGPPLPDVVGVSATTALAPTQSARVKLSNSIVRAGGRPLLAQSTGAGEATVAASYSDYDPSFNKSSGANASIAEANVSNVGDAGFVAWEYGNYRLLPTSRLVDAGDPAAAQGVDLDGNPLVADGNGDGNARRDMGAFEVESVPPGSGPGGTETADTLAPVVRGFSATRTVFSVARASTLLAAGAPGGTRLRYILKRARPRDGRHQASGQARRSRSTPDRRLAHARRHAGCEHHPVQRADRQASTA